MDGQFLDPAVTVIAGERPASITNGAESVISTGSGSAQILIDLQGMIAKLGSFQAPFWVMRPSTAAFIAASSSTLFPLIKATPDGGFLCGIPVLNSMNSPAQITLLDADDVQFADDDQVDIQAAQHASVLMDDGQSPASQRTVSLFQEGLVAIRSERTVSWKRGHDDSVVCMTVAY
jgi:hypothetical protein